MGPETETANNKPKSLYRYTPAQRESLIQNRVGLGKKLTEIIDNAGPSAKAITISGAMAINITTPQKIRFGVLMDLRNLGFTIEEAMSLIGMSVDKQPSVIKT